MARIKIKDLPKDSAISREELNKVLGGSIADAASIVMSGVSTDMTGDLKNAVAQINVIHSVLTQYRNLIKSASAATSGLGDPGDDEGGSIL